MIEPGTHPRPQLTRPWVDLCGDWGFRTDDAETGRDEGWWHRPEVFDRTIRVPYPPESAASGIAERGFHPVVWYRREFRHVPVPGRRLLLHFGAVDYRAAVWVNGRLVAEHEGGHVPFEADVTDALLPDGDQDIVVRAEDRPGDLQQPRGKQDWEAEPHAIWYHRTTGIWQPVWLEEVPATRIDALRWSADLDQVSLRLGARLCRTDDRPLRLRVRLTLHGRLLADDVYRIDGDALRRDIGLAQAMATLGRHEAMWAPEHPNLVDAELELLDGDEVLDRVGSYTALRTVRATEGRFQLNGRAYFLRLVLAQGYWPSSHLAAPDEAALRREVELAKGLGFNGVRLHQKIEDPRFLYWCDRLGLLVWAEMPAAYEFSARTVARLTREWLEVLERDVNHPCVIAWVPINESWGVPALQAAPEQRALVSALYHLTRAMDPTRPVVGNDGWEQVVTDILTVHDYSPRGGTLRDRYGSADAVEQTLRHVQPSYRSVLLPDTPRGQEPVMVTEFGGITLVGTDSDQWLGYGMVRNPSTLLEAYRSLVDALLDSPTLTGFCYTQLTDTLQEQNGLLTEDRMPKVPAEEVYRINCRTSAAVPADAIGSFDFGDYPAPPPQRVEQQPDGRVS
ncbi:MAG: GH2 [uncultured Corynebacteriales bacterium]|uniref:GH2 n=1 Tax=uncultured Mycobacteriales bacterium TaxID=581187 RepID=A0A6J4I133_9ACTN|nr:MAG: GH2 [uncultured Corynebacteriales bacterium]